MTDTGARRLLLACAKAMGQVAYWSPGLEPMGREPGMYLQGRLWNPLTSLADATEMAIKLRIDVTWGRQNCTLVACSRGVYGLAVAITDFPTEQLAYCYAVCQVALRLSEVSHDR